MTIHVEPKGAAELLWFRNSLVNVRLSCRSSAGQVSVIESWLPYGDSPPLHVHRNQDEIFSILEGKLRFHLGGKDVVAHAGQTVLAPKGVPHSFRVESAEGAHVLTTTVGYDFEMMVREMSRAAPSYAMPPCTAPTTAQIEALTDACTRNNIDIVGPPLS
jgi:quercetin dioxygenase-like cupin family protein